MDRVERFWRTFVAATGVDGDYTAWAFGDDADALARLVKIGRKRATTSLFSEYEAEREPLPESGNLSIILNSSRRRGTATKAHESSRHARRSSVSRPATGASRQSMQESSRTSFAGMQRSSPERLHQRGSCLPAAP